MWKEFEAEPNKSAIVNELLRKHYGMGGSVNIKENKDGTVSPRVPSKPSSFTTSPIKPRVDTITFPEIPKEMQPKFCPNGHANPYPRDKCLGQGCN